MKEGKWIYFQLNLFGNKWPARENVSTGELQIITPDGWVKSQWDQK